MEIKAKKKDILNCATKVLPAINPRITIPILANILFETKGKNRVNVMATDLEIGLLSSFECEVLSEGSVTIPAKKFIDIIKELPEEELYLNIAIIH